MGIGYGLTCYQLQNAKKDLTKMGLITVTKK